MTLMMSKGHDYNTIVKTLGLTHNSVGKGSSITYTIDKHVGLTPPLEVMDHTQ